jgi:DNA-binding MarR family transcriptional regulator
MSRARVQPVAILDKLFELAGILGEQMRVNLAERGLTPARAEALLVLSRHESGMVQRELSQALRCSPRHITALIDALETHGFVDRRPHPADRRASLVTLTRRGATATERMDADRRRAATSLFRGMPARDLQGFLDMVDQVLARSRARSA